MRFILQLLTRVEKTLLCLLLIAMIVLACLQIVLRGVFSSGIIWADQLLRYIVLWSGLLGAVLATSRGKHIALDLAGYLIPDRFRPYVELAANIFSVLVSAVLTWAAILFLRSEMEFSTEALFNLPSWSWNAIFPIAFGLITLRFAIQVFFSAQSCLSPQTPPADMGEA